MADKWYCFPDLLDRTRLKSLLKQHEENLTEAGRAIGCSARLVKTALEKHGILLEKERYATTREEMQLRTLLQGDEV